MLLMAFGLLLVLFPALKNTFSFVYSKTPNALSLCSSVKAFFHAISWQGLFISLCIYLTLFHLSAMSVSRQISFFSAGRQHAPPREARHNPGVGVELCGLGRVWVQGKYSLQEEHLIISSHVVLSRGLLPVPALCLVGRDVKLWFSMILKIKILSCTCFGCMSYSSVPLFPKNNSVSG